LLLSFLYTEYMGTCFVNWSANDPLILWDRFYLKFKHNTNTKTLRLG
jgi:hypothetical protein